VTYRDDHDAAIARVDALEEDLDQERERADEKAREAATLRRERDALEQRLAVLEAGKRPSLRPQPAPPPPPPPERDYRDPVDGDGLIVGIVVVMLLIFVVVALVAHAATP
jgi:hypothetical protein